MLHIQLLEFLLGTRLLANQLSISFFGDQHGISIIDVHVVIDRPGKQGNVDPDHLKDAEVKHNWPFFF